MIEIQERFLTNTGGGGAGGMRWCHRHEWKEIARTYCPPVENSPIGNVLNFADARILHGCTTIAFQCQVAGCGKVRTVQMLGKAEGPVEHMEERS